MNCKDKLKREKKTNPPLWKRRFEKLRNTGRALASKAEVIIWTTWQIWLVKI